MEKMNVEQRLDLWIEENKQQLVEDVCSLINIPSISGPPVGQFPYGEGCAKVLVKALSLSEGYGLEIVNHDYRCGTAVLAGEMKQEIGIFTHLDIVPEGDNWLFEPFNALVRQGYIIGRGASDNKGPAMAGLYALRCLRELGISLRHPVRLYYGCDEESGMSDINYYLGQNPAPVFAFTPDCAFPVCNGEKGIMKVSLGAQVEQGNLLDFRGGTVCNMVPSFAYALLSNGNYNTISGLITDNGVEGISVFYEGDRVGVTAEGMSGHAAFPQGTVNAIQKLAAFLDRFGLVEGDGKAFVQFVAQAFQDFYGEGLGIAYSDPLSGPLTHVCSVVSLKDGGLSLEVNIRYPITADQEQIQEEIAARCARYGLEVLRLENDPPSYVPPDYVAVKPLNDICNRILQKEYQPYVMGGGTYARRLPNAVGYGAGIPNQPSPFGKDRGDGHQPDECVKIQDLVNAVKIYCLALIELDTLLD